MLVVIPFHSGDKAQAISLANWIKELGQVSDHKCLVCVGENCDATGVIEPLHEAFKSASVYLPHAKAKRGEGIMGYAKAANAMWQSVAWKIYMQEKCPWLWLEPDAIPTRPTWLNEIDAEYRAFKKPFMGAMGQCQIPMINGVAVYPAQVCEYAPLALQAAECPWDLNAAAQILKHAHVSDLFQHIYQINGEPPTFPGNTDRLNQSTALFHRCKDSSLIAHLKQHGYTKGGDASCAENQKVSTPITNDSENKKRTSASIAAPTVRPARAADFDPDEGLGEPVDYSQRLQEFESTQRARRPNEGERNGDLVWRNGKWHTAPMVSEKAVDRKAVMEKFKHPPTIDIKDPVEEQRERGLSPAAKFALEQEGNLPVEVGVARRDGQVSGSVEGHTSEQLEPKGVQSATSQQQVASDENSSSAQPSPSRDDLVQEAVSVLKRLCTSPVHTSKIRKELKRQKVIK